MIRRLPLAFFAALLLAVACPPAPPADCAAACTAAARCRLLPSTLGGAPDDSVDELAAACTARCDGSDDTAEVAFIVGCLAEHATAPVCATDACTEAADCLRSVTSDETIGEPHVTFRLIDGAHWEVLFRPQVCDAVDPAVTAIDDDEFAALCEGADDPCRGDGQTTASHRLPLCAGDGCDAYEQRPVCDPRLCDTVLSASYDCATMGIETVQFGYLDEDEVLHLAPQRSSCAEASDGVVIEGITPGTIVFPIARFEGRITGSTLDWLDPADPSIPFVPPEAAIGRPYCWLSTPSLPDEVGWFVPAGESLVPVPSPGSTHLEATASGDLRRFPHGCGCLLEGAGCEGVGDDCANDLDDDQDGLIDQEDPGCA